MIITETKIRVRYGETDQMGFVYYGNYPLYYEIGRTEMFRELVSSYNKLEKDGIMMPVMNLSCNYLKPAHYDDLLTIRTIIKEIPRATIKFHYEVYNENNELINKGETTLAFINAENKKPCRPPRYFISFFENKMN
jgi:acyl-CoA thioester hydrolase